MIEFIVGLLALVVFVIVVYSVGFLVERITDRQCYDAVERFFIGLMFILFILSIIAASFFVGFTIVHRVTLP